MKWEMVVREQPPTRLLDGVYLDQDPRYPEDDMVLIIKGDDIAILGRNLEDCHKLAERLDKTGDIWAVKPRLDIDHPDSQRWLDIIRPAKMIKPSVVTVVSETDNGSIPTTKAALAS